MEKLTNIIEAILFASGNAVPMDMLREKLEITKAELDTAVKHLEKKYTGECGIRLLTFNHKLQLATNPEYKDQVGLVLNTIREKEFTKTILECAAIIAYKQPITRSELEELRGVNSDYAVTTLLSLDMIAPFKLRSLADLPDYDEMMRRIAALNAAASETSNYLYEKDVYDPDKDPELQENQEGGEPSDSGESGSSGGSGDFELPDFLKDIHDGIIKIQ